MALTHVPRGGGPPPERPGPAGRDDLLARQPPPPDPLTRAWPGPPGYLPAPDPEELRAQRTGVWRWLPPAIAVGTSAFLGAYLYLVDPNVASNPYPKCPLKALTGIDCPGCGGLRSVNSLLHGDVVGAVDHSLLAVVMVPIMAYFLLRWLLGYAGIDLPKFRVPRWVAWTTPILVLAFSIVRNFEGTPFYFLNSAAG